MQGVEEKLRIKHKKNVIARQNLPQLRALRKGSKAISQKYTPIARNICLKFPEAEQMGTRKYACCCWTRHNFVGNLSYPL